MTIIKKNGAPTKYTVGAIDDIYEDIDTGKRYKCECICTVSGGLKEYEWKETTQDIEDDPEPEIPVTDDIPEEESEPVVDEKKPEQPVRNQPYNQNRNTNRNGYKTQYNKQYRPNNK